MKSRILPFEDRFSMCCRHCLQPLIGYKTDNELWGLGCPDILSPPYFRKSSHTLYETSIPVLLKPDFEGMICRAGLVVTHINGSHLKVMERVIGRGGRNIIRDITVIYRVYGDVVLENVEPVCHYIITNECNSSKSFVDDIREYNGELIIGRERT